MSTPLEVWFVVRLSFIELNNNISFINFAKDLKKIL